MFAVLLALGCTSYRYMTPAVTADGRVLMPYSRDGVSKMLECRLPDKVFTLGARMECVEVEVEVVGRGRSVQPPRTARAPAPVEAATAAPAPKAPATGNPGPLAWLEGDWAVLHFAEAAKGAPAARPVHLSSSGTGDVTLGATVGVPRWRQGACGSATTVRVEATYTVRVAEERGNLTVSLRDPRIKTSTCAAANVDPGLGATSVVIRGRDGGVLVADRFALIRARGSSPAIAPPPDSSVIAERWTLSTPEVRDAAALHITAVGNGLGGTWSAARKIAVPTWKRSACGGAAELTAVERCTLEGRISGAEVTLAVQGCKITGCPCEGVCKGAVAPRSFRAWVTAGHKHMVGASLLLTRD